MGPAWALGAYLVGSVSSALLVSARYGIDPRTAGSRNPGATNVGRLLGKRAGRLVMVLDILKGFVPAWGARLMLGEEHVWTAAAGFAAVLGHVAPVFHRFQGGKGAATSAGVLLATVPWAGVAAGIGFVVAKKGTRRASVGSLFGAGVGTAIAIALHGLTTLGLMAVALGVLVVLRHVPNIRRLLRGEELSP